MSNINKKAKDLEDKANNMKNKKNLAIIYLKGVMRNQRLKSLKNK